jgi:hypothetical protein
LAPVSAAAVVVEEVAVAPVLVEAVVVEEVAVVAVVVEAAASAPPSKNMQDYRRSMLPSAPRLLRQCPG